MCKFRVFPHIQNLLVQHCKTFVLWNAAQFSMKACLVFCTSIVGCVSYPFYLQVMMMLLLPLYILQTHVNMSHLLEPVLEIAWGHQIWIHRRRANPMKVRRRLHCKTFVLWNAAQFSMKACLTICTSIVGCVTHPFYLQVMLMLLLLLLPLCILQTHVNMLHLIKQVLGMAWGQLHQVWNLRRRANPTKVRRKLN